MTTLLLLYDVAMPAALMSLVWWAMVLRRQRDEARRERDGLRALLPDAGANQGPRSTGTVTVSPLRWRGAVSDYFDLLAMVVTMHTVTSP